MANIIEIDNLDNSEISIYRELTDCGFRSRLETDEGIFIAESPKVIKVALEAGLKPISILTTHKLINGAAREIIESCGDIPVYTGSDETLSGIAGYKLTRGVLCAMQRPELPDVEDICETASRIVVLDTIADSTNVGAIFRSAAALGIDAVLLTPTCCDPLNRRSVRVSMGTVFQIPWTYICSDHKSWPHPGLEMLKAMGFCTLAMALDKDATPLDSPTLANKDKLAIIMGTEGDGLSQKTIAGCDHTVRIPMFHNVDSLNVAAASAVTFWQLRK